MSKNSESWNQSNVVSFFDQNRSKSKDVYPSEWFFLKDQLKENLSVLDIGCAQGGFAGIIGEHLSNFNYTGIDISQEMIKKASKRYPEHTFHHINEADYSCLKEKYDLTIVLGILHLHETWKNTIKAAWSSTKTSLILDLRETFEITIEDKKKSYFKMNINGENNVYSEVLPYNLINSSEALEVINSICVGAKKISYYGYSQEPASTSIVPYKKIFATVYLIQKEI